MRQLIQNLKSGSMSIEEVPAPLLTEQSVLVSNHFSVISAGTEKSKVDLAKKNLLQKALARPDLVKQVWKKVKTEGLMKTYQTVNSRLEAPSPLGYSSAGIVEAVGVFVEGIMPGDRVACAGAGYANHADMVAVPKNLVVKIPDAVSLEEAAFTTIGAIALQGVRLAKPELDESFLILGLGLIGQITVQILLANGCRVIGYDPDPVKRKLAKEFGAVVVEQAEEVKSTVDLFTNNHGVDGVIICAGTASNQPIETAGEVARSKGRVIVVGAVGMNIPREPYFKKELKLMISRSYGPGRYDPYYEENGIDYPYDYVRFTEKRNMESFLELIAQKKIQIKPLITHQYKFEEAVAAYQLLEQANQLYLGILLQYDQAQKKEKSIHKTALEKVDGKINISCIGCGNYATANILPVLAKTPELKFQGIMSASGRTAENVAKKFGFAASLTKVDEALDNNSDLVMIMTRHDSHAELVQQALKANKHVFVEKPLAISLAEYNAVQEVLNENTHSHLLIGFNRRFSPLITQMKAFFAGIKAPKIINIRVNAGKIPADHWIQNPQIGGGRIIGEACHFVDLASAIAEADPIAVKATCLKMDVPVILQDNVQITMRLADGSVANIIYTSSGASTMAKEYIEVFSAGKSAIIDDFKSMTLFDATKQETIKLKHQDKGQHAMINHFINSLKTNVPLVPRQTLMATSLATLLVIESLSLAEEINLA